MDAIESRITLPGQPTLPQVVLSTPDAYHECLREENVSKASFLDVNPLTLPPFTSQQPKQQKSHTQELEVPGQLLPDQLEISEAGRKRCSEPLLPLPQKPAGETYGTQVLFLNNQESAADIARNEHKLMFVMHISGNFEDSCFT